MGRGWVHACPCGRFSTPARRGGMHPPPPTSPLPCVTGGRRRPGYLSVGFWGGPGGLTTQSLLSAWFWAGVCPAGLVGGQDTQPGSTRTPSPAVAVVAGGSSSSGLSARTYLGGGVGTAAHSTNGPDRQMARNPRRPAVPLWGGDIPRAPGCSLGVTICWLWGDTQPSRLTCSSIPATTDRIGTPR